MADDPLDLVETADLVEALMRRSRVMIFASFNPNLPPAENYGWSAKGSTPELRFVLERLNSLLHDTPPDRIE